jgi:uncharacterized membrane protein
LRSTIQTEALVGTFLLAGAPLATVHPSGLLIRDHAAAIRGAFVLGPERTRQQDVELGIRKLADIAVRALSPAVNDPTTATMSIDRLGQLLVQAAQQDDVELIAGAAGGQVVLRRPEFSRLCDVAFTQIRHYGAGDTVVAIHVMETLGEVASRVPETRQEPLRKQAAALLAESTQALIVREDMHRLEDAAAWIRVESRIN